jgi:hypothetical protein
MKAKVGDQVHAMVGTKDGWGKVLEARDDGFYVVEFPDVDYPHTMVQPTGQYIVREDLIVEVK